MAELNNRFQQAFSAHQAGHAEEAERKYREILAEAPDHPFSLHFMGLLLADRQQLPHALELMRRSIELSPAIPEFHNNMGIVLEKTGAHEEALQCYTAAIRAHAGFSDAYCNRADILATLGRLDEALADYRQSIDIAPNHAKPYFNMAGVFCAQGRVDNAIEMYRQAIALRPDYFLACRALAILLQKAGRHAEAAEAFRQAIRLQPGHPELHQCLGATLDKLGDLTGAFQAYRQLLLLDPRSGSLIQFIYYSLIPQHIDFAISALRETLELLPDHHVLHSFLIWLLDRAPAVALAEQQEERRRWDWQHVRSKGIAQLHPGNDRDPERKLRVGIVSGEFYQCSTVYGYGPFLFYRNRALFDVVCYSNSETEDGMTRRIREAATLWRDIRGIPDEEVVKTIRQDGIDILIDISSHSWTTSRLHVFGYKPAPIQATGWGYAGGSGLGAMDYLLNDAVIIPAGERAHYVEEIADLSCVIGYLSPDNAPMVGPSPFENNGFVTFGCFNHIHKLYKDTLSLWAEILSADPTARLVLKYHGMDGPENRDYLARFFADRGISPSRLTLMGGTDWHTHMAAYNMVDIALDPFPSSGGVTTLDALWMGAPAVTLYEKSIISRSSASIMSVIGLEELVAHDEREYWTIATRLAQDRPRLAHLRQGMRERVASSPIGAENYAKEAERLFRNMWRRFCNANDAGRK
ncbi:MAG TPA: tetratricopeptide repeat protein [Novimethylophilus sp.]|uniref:tetratricopeptide repeat protein n=1 Tax=Novimethylophilus sp. TaxID=2137426 RepID=UPI002F414E44